MHSHLHCKRLVSTGYMALAVTSLTAAPAVAAELACSNPTVVSIIKEQAEKFARDAFEGADGVAMNDTVTIALSNYLPTRADENTKDCTADMRFAYKGHVVSDAINYTAGKTEDGNFVAQWYEPGTWARSTYEQWCMQAGVRPRSLAERLQEQSAKELIERMQKKTRSADPDWSQFNNR